MKTIIVATLGLVVLVGGVYFSDRTGSGSEAIKLGAVLSLTGQAATDAEEMKRGIDLAVADLAERGVEVTVVLEDDGTDTKRTVAAFEKLASVDNVDAIIGPTWSFLGDAAAPVIARTKVPTFAPALTSEFSTPGETMFFGSLKNSERADSIAVWMREQNLTKVAIIVDNGTWGLSILPAFHAAAQKAGVEVVHEAKVQAFGADPAVVQRELASVRASGAEAIVMSGYQDFTTILMKRSQEIELDMPILITQQFVFEVVQNGSIILRDTDQFFVSYAGTSDSFKAKYRAVYNEEPGEYADRAYDGVMLLVEGIQNRNEGQSLPEYLSTESQYQGYAATYDFDERGDIVGGEWVIRQVVE